MRQTPYTRVAVFFVPQDNRLRAFGAHWFGWDIVDGRHVPRTVLPADAPLSMAAEHIIQTPRKYGFHGTIRAPFRLREPASVAALSDAVSEVLAQEPAVRLPALRVARLGRFLALVPDDTPPDLHRLAERVLRGVERFRAPLSAQDRVRRRPERLTDHQRALLDTWGYPFVLDQFRFHMTLTGRLPDADLTALEKALPTVLPDAVAQDTQITSLCLCGERPDGWFELITRAPLNG